MNIPDTAADVGSGLLRIRDKRTLSAGVTETLVRSHRNFPHRCELVRAGSSQVGTACSRNSSTDRAQGSPASSPFTRARSGH